MSEIVRIRESRWTLLVLVPGAVPFALSTVDLWTRAPGEPAEPDAFRAAWWAACVVIVALVVPTVFRPPGFDLTPGELVVRRLFPARRIAWRDIAYIDVDRRGRTRIHPATGRPFSLSYPSRQLFLRRDRFVADHHRLGDWWLAHRGPDWRPLVPPPPGAPLLPGPPAPSGPPRTVETIWRTPPGR